MACDQPWTVPLLFKILVSGPPVLCIIASLLFLHRYHINEKDRAEIAEKLRLLRYSKIYNVTLMTRFVLYAGEIQMKWNHIQPVVQVHYMAQAILIVVL